MKVSSVGSNKQEFGTMLDDLAIGSVILVQRVKSWRVEHHNFYYKERTSQTLCTEVGQPTGMGDLRRGRSGRCYACAANPGADDKA